ncbi:MAG TPA: iron-sulfur cluster assembly scaffold protein [Candidatus Acidoferrales bacterium]
MFNETILEHFRNPRNAGDLADANAQIEVTNPVCGDILRLAARVVDGRIVGIRFKTQGCVAAIAASSVLTEMLTGRPTIESREITAQSVAERLGGLPPASFHAAQLCADGAGALGRQILHAK